MQRTQGTAPCTQLPQVRSSIACRRLAALPRCNRPTTVVVHASNKPLEQFAVAVAAATLLATPLAVSPALASTQDEVLRDVTAQIRTAAKDMADAVNAIDAAVEAVTEFANTPAEEAATQESPAVLVEAPAVVEAPVAVVVEPEVVVAPPVVAAETAPPPPVVVAPVAPSTPAPAVAPRPTVVKSAARGADSSLKTPLQNVMDTLYSVTHGNVVASEGTCTPGK